uniref:2,3-bisphosphoglycerate-independent phosphoglycerate mutase n=1 Tax=Lygus hesperus TaxID=30085 RepID=A0A0A9XEY7_LYGHE
MDQFWGSGPPDTLQQDYDILTMENLFGIPSQEQVPTSAIETFDDNPRTPTIDTQTLQTIDDTATTIQPSYSTIVGQSVGAAHTPIFSSLQTDDATYMQTTAAILPESTIIPPAPITLMNHTSTSSWSIPLPLQQLSVSSQTSVPPHNTQGIKNNKLKAIKASILSGSRSQKSTSQSNTGR